MALVENDPTTAGGPVLRSRQPGRNFRTRRRAVASCYVLPVLLITGVFVYYPIILGILYAFQSVDFIRANQWVGFQNFTRVLSDPQFGKAWSNTFLYTLLVIVFAQLLPLLMAMAMHEIRVWKRFFQVAAYLPAVVPPVASALLWNWLFDPSRGLLNAALQTFGLKSHLWLSSSSEALASIGVITVWAGWGFAALVYLAALQTVPPELYEAAEIDGAGALARIRYVTLPHVRGLMLILIILGVIGSMQLFTEPYVLTQGGPVSSTTTVVLLIYRYAFAYGDIGGASALSVTLLIFLALFSALYMWLTRKISGA